MVIIIHQFYFMGLSHPHLLQASTVPLSLIIFLASDPVQKSKQLELSDRWQEALIIKSWIETIWQNND